MTASDRHTRALAALTALVALVAAAAALPADARRSTRPTVSTRRVVRGTLRVSTAQPRRRAGGGLEASSRPTASRPGCSGVRLAPGADVAGAAAAHPAGTTFCLGAGTYAVDRPIKPRNGQSFVGEGPATVLTGRGATAAAFDGPGAGVTIRALRVEAFANDYQSNGAIDSADRWRIDEVVVAHNAARGLRIGGDGVRVTDSRFLNNGQIGIAGGGNHSLIARNEVAFNNSRHFPPGCCSGGIKQGGNRGQVFRNNHVHDNDGPGIWCDVGCVDALIERNRVVNNSMQGIMYEISFDAVIRNNVVVGNGFGRGNHAGYGAGIMISSSAGSGPAPGELVEVYGNVLRNNHNGIAVTQQNRGITVRNVFVHDNRITMLSPNQRTGVWSADRATLTRRNVRFEDNDYFVACGVDAERWNLARGVPKRTWRRAGFDDTRGATFACV
jgi:hypothetical protein